jgi:hemin uptake protein HemP
MPQSHATPPGVIAIKVPDPVRPTSLTLTSSRLFGGAPTLFIEHAGQRYTLRITRENKLILTK